MNKLKGLLKLPILIPVILILLLGGVVGYVVFAPSTWWKPFYVSVVTEDSPTPTGSGELASTNGMVAGAGDVAGQMAAPAGAPQQASPIANLQSEQNSGVMYELDTKVVNLAEPGGLRYLQTSVVLELWPLTDNFSMLEGEERLAAGDLFKETIDRRRPVIDDIVTTHLSSKTFNEIATVEGKQALKEELIVAINENLGYQGVMNIYFTDFIVQ
ncbi:MAG: flagellar basal body-associated FliL family protein [Anaerolineae bacterium]|nr:flagellar basal body-associated FliL family protein [Anaerolineae bacterium]